MDDGEYSVQVRRGEEGRGGRKEKSGENNTLKGFMCPDALYGRLCHFGGGEIGLIFFVFLAVSSVVR